MNHVSCSKCDLRKDRAMGENMLAFRQVGETVAMNRRTPADMNSNLWGDEEVTEGPKLPSIYPVNII